MLEELCVPLTINEIVGIERVREPISIGIPFPKGEIYDASLLFVSDKDGKDIPFAARALNNWSDGSLRWILFDLQISLMPHEEKSFYMIKSSKTKNYDIFPYIVDIEENDKEFVIRTGKAIFRLDRVTFRPFKKVTLNDSEIIDLNKSRFILVDDKSLEWETRVNRSYVELQNNLKAVLYFEGCFTSINVGTDHDLRFKSRLFFWAGHSLALVEFTIWNPRAAKHPGGLWDLGDEGSRFFKELSLELLMRPDNNYTSQYCTEPAGKIVNARDVCIYQDSSGGENWESRNHVNRLGQVPLSFRGYRVYRSGSVIDEGLRATPIISITNGKVGVAGTVRHFWQNSPSSFREGRRNW